MADIATYPFLRHLRAEPTAHVLRYRRGALVSDGPGLTFWFRPIHTAVAEVPEIRSSVPPNVLLALALRELAGQLGQIDHLTITPDMLAPVLARLGE